jgi:hypothetical protein
MTRTGYSAAAAGLVLTLLAAGCGAMDAPDDTSKLADSRASVRAAMADALVVLGDGLAATGGWQGCGMQPAPGQQYVAVAEAGGTSVDEQTAIVQRLASALTAAGWEAGDAGTTGYAFAQFRHGGELLAITASPRAVQPVTVSVRGRCISTESPADTGQDEPIEASGESS